MLTKRKGLRQMPITDLESCKWCGQQFRKYSHKLLLHQPKCKKRPASIQWSHWGSNRRPRGVVQMRDGKMYIAYRCFISHRILIHYWMSGRGKPKLFETPRIIGMMQSIAA